MRRARSFLSNLTGGASRGKGHGAAACDDGEVAAELGRQLYTLQQTPMFHGDTDHAAAARRKGDGSGKGRSRGPCRICESYTLHLIA
jgi:hypothetical protein